MHPKKSLGQHWLFDAETLRAMSLAAEVTPADTVLEVGPGLGTLTEALLATGASVVAVEFDADLATDLPKNIARRQADASSERNIKEDLDQALNTKLRIVNEDILKFDLNVLPPHYKVAANIPYYLTSNLIRRLLESDNPPSVMALLVQKEVAQRIVAQPGNMSILAVSVQFYAEACLKQIVPAQLFTPPPKVDSQILQIKRRSAPLFLDINPTTFFTVVRAGFSEKRKKLRSSLSGGLHIPKAVVDLWLAQAGISTDARAQELSLEQWRDLVLHLPSD